MSESKESPGFVLNDAPRDPSYYHSPEPPVEEPPAPPAAQEDTAPQPEPRLVPHAAPPEPPPSKSRRWGLRLAMVIVFIALAALFTRLIPGTEPSPEQTVGTTESQTTATEAPTDPPGNWEDNVLMAAPEGIRDLSYKERPFSPVFGSDITRQEICTVTFLSSTKESPDDAWDASAAGDGSVLAWVIPNGDLYDLYIAGNGGVNGAEACSYLFSGYINLTYIDFGTSFNTERVTDMISMFSYCYNLLELDLSNFNTEQVTDMAAMFFSCSSLTELTLSSFNTERVTDMGEMFVNCGRLEELDLSSFNTEQVADMCYMFDNCSNLTELTLSSNFNTKNVESMSHMFNNCSNLTELDLSNFNTESVTHMWYMFSGCPGVTVEDVAHFDTSSVKYYAEFMDGTGWEYLFE